MSLVMRKPKFLGGFYVSCGCHNNGAEPIFYIVTQAKPSNSPNVGLSSPKKIFTPDDRKFGLLQASRNTPSQVKHCRQRLSNLLAEYLYLTLFPTNLLKHSHRHHNRLLSLYCTHTLSFSLCWDQNFYLAHWPLGLRVLYHPPSENEPLQIAIRPQLDHNGAVAWT